MKDMDIIEWGTSHFDDFLANSSDQELKDFLGTIAKAKELVYAELINRGEYEETTTLGGDNCYIGRGLYAGEPDTIPIDSRANGNDSGFGYTRIFSD